MSMDWTNQQLSFPHKFNRACRSAALFFLLAWALAGCKLSGSEETCSSCHGRLEHASKSHAGCAGCHGGNPKASEKELAHAGMRGKANPSAPGSWTESCGRCHRYQLERVKANIMFTNAGMIRNIQLTWEGEDGRAYTTGGGKGFTAAGGSLETAPVVELDNLGILRRNARLGLRRLPLPLER
jgi:hypothetical protein